MTAPDTNPFLSTTPPGAASVEPHAKLLTIAIPTYNRSGYLDLCLSQLCKQWRGHENQIEILVSNNMSTDDTDRIADKYMSLGYPLVYIKNAENIGSDRNIAQCFHRALGKYVLILGDDDVLVDTSVGKIIEELRTGDYGVVFLQPYGYDHDFAKERPLRLFKRKAVYIDKGKFIRKLGVYSTFISANIINKSLIHSTVDPYSFAGTNLVQLFLIYHAVLASQKNLYLPEYLVACKRNNSGGYNFISIFVTNLNNAFNDFSKKGLPAAAFEGVNKKLITWYFPYYILRMRERNETGLLDPSSLSELYKRYGRYFSFKICIVPLIKWPLATARLWGLVVIVISRIANGEISRLVSYAWNKLRFAIRP